MAPRVDLAPLPPREAVRFFENKGFAIGFDWRDVWQEEHARAFTVAKAMRQDILRDIRTAVDDAIRNGTTREQFKRDLIPTLQRKGWWGRAIATDPLTGETGVVQLGSPRRLNTIFDVNMRMAHAAGRWERAQRVKEQRPFLRYVQLDRATKRQAHVPWHGTILPIDHPWWDTHFTPNGWGCACRTMQLSERDLERFGFEVSEDAPPGGTRRFRNPRTGETVEVPEGIDPGFAYNVGKAHMAGLTPPPRPGGIPPPFSGPPPDAPMPPPRPAPSGRVLPAGLGARDTLDRFLDEFGAAPGKTVVHTDVIGEPVVIGEDLFRRKSGRLRVDWRGRGRDALLIADTIKRPDEIWWQWEEARAGRLNLVRRYLARWEIEDQTLPTFVLFDIGNEGWSAVTGATEDRVSYLLRQRGGTLAYRRPNS